MSRRPGLSFTFVSASISDPCSNKGLRSAWTGERARPALAVSFGLEIRWPFLHIRRQAFLGVFALKQQLLVFTFHRESGLHGNLPPGLHRAFDTAHSLGRLVGRE